MAIFNGMPNMVASNLYLKSFRVNRHLYSLQLSKEKLFFSFYLMIYFYCWFLCKCCWWIYRENAKKKILCIKALEEINIIEVLLETPRTFLCWRHSVFCRRPPYFHWIPPDSHWIPPIVS